METQEFTKEIFEENPIMMMRAVRLVAESGSAPGKSTYKAIAENEYLLSGADEDMIREEFEGIITAEFAGKGLGLLAKTGLLSHIIGNLADNMTRRALTQFEILVENIDKTKRIRERRLGIFYFCFEKKAALEAARFINYDSEIIGRITDAHDLLDSMNFITDKYELKKFMAKCGADRYKYLDGLSKAYRIVYDLPDSKILGRHYYMDEIEANSEAIFVDDLKIDEDDIVKRDIADRENAGDILDELLKLVHKNPGLNNKHDLLFNAQKLSKSKMRTAFKKVKRMKLLK